MFYHLDGVSVRTMITDALKETLRCSLASYRMIDAISYKVIPLHVFHGSAALRCLFSAGTRTASREQGVPVIKW